MRTITKIEVQKNNAKRCSIYIDEEFAFGIDIDAIGIYNIQKGNVYTDAEYEHLLNELQYEKAKYAALNYIGYSPRTTKQMIEKLQLYEYDEIIISKVMSFLTRYGYIDDAKYVEDYIPNRIKSKRHGKQKIIYDLMQKGISKELIEPILEKYRDDEYESAMYLYNKKSKGQIILDYKSQGKIYRYLQGKGYSYDLIRAVIQEHSSHDSTNHDA